MEKINDLMSAFKEKVEKLASRLIEAVGGPEAISAPLVRRAVSRIEGKDVWEDGSVYDPEYPVRLAILEATLGVVSPIEDDWLWDFLYQSPTRKYTSDMEEKAWSEGGWKDLLKELDEFGEEDLATQINELKKEV